MSAARSDDVVDVLIKQHAQLRALFTRVRAAGGDDRKRLFTELTDLLYAHEHGERVVVHPILRDRTHGGTATAVSYIGADERISQKAAELQDLGVDHPLFDARLDTLRQAVLDHAAAEEADEFPRLRTFVPAQRLHQMANELRNVQTLR